MTTQSTTTLPATPSAPILPVGFQFTDEDLAIFQAVLPEKAKDQRADVLRFWRELPRLLAEGHEDRFALIYEGQLISLWDTLGDATQAGYNQFGPDGRFLTSPIRALELQRLRQYLVQQRSKQCPS